MPARRATVRERRLGRVAQRELNWRVIQLLRERRHITRQLDVLLVLATRPRLSHTIVLVLFHDGRERLFRLFLVLNNLNLIIVQSNRYLAHFRRRNREIFDLSR